MNLSSVLFDERITMNFYERYEKCCKEQNISPVSQSAADSIGCSKSTISNLSKTGQTPKGDTIAGISNMLNISADYFLGLCPEPVPIAKPISEEEIELINILSQLNHDGKLTLLALGRGLLTEPIYKNTDNSIQEKVKGA